MTRQQGKAQELACVSQKLGSDGFRSSVSNTKWTPHSPPPLWQALTEPTDRAVQGSHSLRAEPVKLRCKNQPKPIPSALSVPLPFLPSHIFHHYNLGQQTSSLVRQSVRQVLVYAQCWISLCNSGSCTTKNKFSSPLTSLNMYGLEMLGWFLLAQFCWKAILSRQQREEGSGPGPCDFLDICVTQWGR